MYSWSSPTIPAITRRNESLPTTVSVFDTATKTLAPVGPQEGEARLYVCGITPYDATHLGHANTYVAFDLLNRAWRDLGLSVNYTQNVTDVDDPLLERAQLTGQNWDELAASQIELFRTDMRSLRVIAPTHYIGAIECIPCVVQAIDRLKDSGLVYQLADGEHSDWYFKCSEVDGFGTVANLGDDDAVETFAQRGGDPDRPGKSHLLDCLLWRQERDGEPAWQSSLGPGRPGWHIECTAIALKYLGESFDVQAGGSDLVFPHHEMCASQAIALTGKPLAKAFVHSGMVALDGEKMSKSKGNLELVSRLLTKDVDPMAIRLAIMAHHYRADWEWTQTGLDVAIERLARWRSVQERGCSVAADATIDAMRQAMRTDLDAPAAIEAVDAWVDASLASTSVDARSIKDVTVAVDALLGIAL